LAGILGRWASRLFRQPVDLALRNPVILLLVLRIAEELFRRWTAILRFRLGRQQLLCLTDEVEGETIQGCLLSTEHLLSMGRVEKRTLFTRPLLDMLCGNEYLRRELLRAAKSCRKRSANCLVTRWLPPDERYHVLQASLNQASAMFGPNFVHFNALDGESSGGFKSTWYCITVMTPTINKDAADIGRLQGPDFQRTRWGSIVDESALIPVGSPQPVRGTLRVVLANESDLRRIADGKLNPPACGFFNGRHRERYKILQDFSASFHSQLVRTPADIRSASSRSPFTNERAHSLHNAKPDGGSFKRVHSQPQLSQLGRANGGAETGRPKRPSVPHLLLDSGKWPPDGEGTAPIKRAEVGVEGEDNCFLRLHVPHYLGHQSEHSNVIVASATSGPEVVAAVRRALNDRSVTGSISDCGGGRERRASAGDAAGLDNAASTPSEQWPPPATPCFGVGTA